VAGSWNHIVNRNGKFQGTLLIENLGDAYEALEECYGMIQYLADVVATEWGQEHAAVIREAKENHEAGLRIGGMVQRRYFGGGE
jgi:lipopolysaccharide biosynthesis regulator YciM